MRRLAGAALGLLLLASPAPAAWDHPMAGYMGHSEFARSFVIGGYLGMWEATSNRYCEEHPTIGLIRETIEQWYRMGRLDPTTKLSVAILAALKAHCPPEAAPIAPRKPGA
jgi:hypothetical protein